MLKTVFFSLSAQLAVGQLLIAALISRQTIGNLFHRVIAGVSLLLLVLALWAEPYDSVSLGGLLSLKVSAITPESLALTFAVLSVLHLLLNQLLFPRLHRATLLLSFVLGLTAVVCDGLTYPGFHPARASERLLAGLNAVSSAMILGGVLGAMITGHWYLVRTKLSLQPLKIAAGIFIGAVLTKTVLIVATLATYWTGPDTLLADLARRLISFAPESLFFWARFSFGILAPLFFSYLIWGTVKIRSTQSATGILYASLILVLLGEAFGKFLYYFSGIPT